MRNAVPILLLCMGAAVGDTIVVDGAAQRGVYVRETQTHYYVCSPRDGSVTTVPREGEQAVEVTRSDDRDELRRQWLARRGERPVSGSITWSTGADAVAAPPVVQPSGDAPTLVIKGDRRVDPAREAARLQYGLAERARELREREARRQALEAERRRREQEAYEGRMRDLRLREQSLRVDALARENARRDRYRNAVIGWIDPWWHAYGWYVDPWTRVTVRPGRETRSCDPPERPDPRPDDGEERGESRIDRWAPLYWD